VVPQNQRASIYRRLCHEAPTVPVLGSNEVSRTLLANAYYALGNSLRIRKSFFRARQAFSEATSLTPENPHYCANLAYAVLLQGDYITIASLKSRLYNDAKILYEQAININPKTAWYHLYLSSALGRLRRWDDAIKELAETIHLDDKNSEARLALAYCLIRLGKFADAVIVLDQLNVSELPPQLRRDLVNSYAQAGDYAKAIAVSESASQDLQDANQTAGKLQIEPQNAELNIELGKIHSKWKNFQTAAVCYRNAISADPAKPDYQKLLGDSLFEDGDWQGSASAWEEFLKSNPDDAVTIYRTGLAYDALEQSQRAMTFYRRAISLPPDQSAPLSVLAGSHYRLAEIEEAKQAYEKALELKINFPAVHFGLGNCYFKLGQLNDAISEWEAAIVAPDSQYVEAYYNLGIAFWLTAQGSVENQTKANLCWTRALFLDPNLTVAEENIAAIETLDEQNQPHTPKHLEIFDLLHTRGV
jgi:tetratricopeptide (TPR) repeat protein